MWSLKNNEYQYLKKTSLYSENIMMFVSSLLLDYLIIFKMDQIASETCILD